MSRVIKLYTPKNKQTELPKTAGVDGIKLNIRPGSKSMGSR